MAFPRTRLRPPGERRIEKMTKSRISALSEEAQRAGKTIEATDSMQPGLKLVAYKSGKVVWRHRWTDKRSKKKRFFTIGCANSISPELARECVRQRVARIALGLDPDAAEDEGCPTMESFLEEDFLPHARRKYKSMKDIENRIKNWIKPQFGATKLSEISKADVIRFHEDSLDKRSAATANRNLSLVSSIMARAVAMGIIDRNPAKGLKKFNEGDSRDRFLDDSELVRFLQAARKKADKGNLSAQAILLALMTGKRRSELLSLTWSRVNLREKFLLIPSTRTKNKKYDRVELNSQAHALLCEMARARDKSVPWVFPSRSAEGHLTEVRRTLKAILKEASIQDFRFHDCRRTHASILINSGASIYDVKAILNHEDIRSTQIYARLARSSVAKTSELAAKKIEEAFGG